VVAKKNVARSASSKAPTGVPGFDELSHGGLPRNRTALAIGGPGTCKTVLALRRHFLPTGWVYVVLA
jgi:KaiC/GvpD/RAD55 family RecA-like ATPase